MQLLGGLLRQPQGATSAPLGQLNTAPGAIAPPAAAVQPNLMGALVQGAAAQNPMLAAVMQAINGPGFLAGPQGPIRPGAAPVQTPPVRPAVTTTPPAIAASTTPTTTAPLVTGGGRVPPPERGTGGPPALADQLPRLFESQNNLILKAMQRRAREGQGGGVRGGR